MSTYKFTLVVTVPGFFSNDVYRNCEVIEADDARKAYLKAETIRSDCAFLLKHKYEKHGMVSIEDFALIQ